MIRNSATLARRTVTATGAATLIAVSLVGSAPFASAATTNWGNGTVGVPMNITISGLTQGGTESDSCGNLQLTLVPSINGIAQTPVVANAASGSATFVWSPASTGTATFVTTSTGLGGCDPVSSTGSVTISSVGTTTTIAAPNNARVGTATQITVNVQSTSPSAYSPKGQVVVKDINGAVVQTMNLTDGPGTGQSYAYWWWTPQTAGSYTFQATYVPAGGTFATASTSAQDVVIATPSGNTISLTAPPSMNVGTPVTLTATVYPATLQGSVGFTVNGAWITGFIPLVNGVATTQWTPTAPGQVTLGASYTTPQGGSGSTTDVVTVQAGPAQQDAITLVQPGWGPWAPNGTYTLGNGSNFTFQASSLSGAPVTLSETGPCGVSGLTINVPVGSGTCNLQATSTGGRGYAPVTYGYTINAIPGAQTAILAAPPSGKYKVGRSLVLESPQQQDTSAGQNIEWTVKKATRANCKLQYPSSGAVTLKLIKKGKCNVVGTAPGVPGQWQPFKTARNYVGR